MPRLRCGGGLEYLHYSSVDGKRRQKGNPVPCSWGIKTRGTGVHVVAVSDETVRSGYGSCASRNIVIPLRTTDTPYRQKGHPTTSRKKLSHIRGLKSSNEPQVVADTKMDWPTECWS
jgi:hypothetical protein